MRRWILSRAGFYALPTDVVELVKSFELLGDSRKPLTTSATNGFELPEGQGRAG